MRTQLPVDKDGVSRGRSYHGKIIKSKPRDVKPVKKNGVLVMGDKETNNEKSGQRK